MRESDSLRGVRRAGDSQNEAGLVQCPVCDTYLKKDEGFTCPSCKRGPLCSSHRVRGKRECASCVLELQATELGDLKRQEDSIRSFLRFLQFLFVVFAIVFVALRTGIAETMAVLQYSIIPESLELIGGLSVVGYVLFYLILYNQRQRIRGLESEMNESRFRRFAR